MSKVVVKNLTKIFGKKQKQALELMKEKVSKAEILEKVGATVGVYNASFNVEEGEIFVIMGLSGSGKSTLVRLLNQLIEPTSGTIEIDGIDIAKLNKKELREVRRTKINMVFQNFGLFAHRTILKNVEYGLEIRGFDKEEREKKALNALDNSGLLEYKDQYPHQLSGGMQQRVGLARALANDAEILLMDEAFSALDPLIRKEMQDELLELQLKMKKTIIFITHDLDESLRLGDRIALMKDGEIVQIGTGEEILTNPANSYVENFVENVDRSKVLTAESVMIDPKTINLDTEGPNVALQRMRKNEISSLTVIDRDRTLKGYITAADAVEARKDGKPLIDYLRHDMVTIDKDTYLNEVFTLIYDSAIPIAVVSNNKLRGILIKGVVLQALAKDGEVNINV
ncbi:glycine betaine/L-proline ABC transporter ATP-binding protein [Erysipelotrichaceae bacterium OttesenSCG-928-M19]|nr:glycine betaine/L-proline ABC transporter ATP-binding protein [Erysipelotrichaceae bacterium OttesenSCG-928-M19]